MSNDKITLNLGGWPLFITVLLCILKLTGVISISWWWCFCLLWLPFLIIIALVLIMIFLCAFWILISMIIEICRR
jgi:hypothetical protein